MNFTRTLEASTAPGGTERRAQARIALRCPILLFPKSGAEPVRAATVNISSKGMYWVSEIPFAPPEIVRCMIFITPDGFRSSEGGMCLDCQVEVVRMEHITAGFGAGVRICRYTVSTHPNRNQEAGSALT